MAVMVNARDADGLHTEMLRHDAGTRRYYIHEEPNVLITLNIRLKIVV